MIRILGILMLLLTLGACGNTSTIGQLRDYQIDCVARDNSSLTMNIYTAAEVKTEGSMDQQSSAEQKVTPDALATGAGIVGKLLVP